MQIKTMSYNNGRDNSRGDDVPRGLNNNGNPQEEMKQVETDVNRALQEDILRCQIESLSVPSRLSVSASNNASANLRSPSSLLAGLGQYQSLLTGGHNASLLAGLAPSSLMGSSGSSFGSNPAASWNQIQADNLFLRQLASMPNSVRSSGLSTDRSALSSMVDGNIPNHRQPPSGAAWQGRVGSGQLFSTDAHAERINQTTGLLAGRRIVGAGASKEMDPQDEQGGSDEEGESDREEDALSDDAYYKKRNKVETIEDLRLQNETFPVKLYRMLYEVEKDGKADVVSFLPHGRSFYIHKQNEFGLILPKYFSTDRMASFQRQLNLYGFRRITE